MPDGLSQSEFIAAGVSQVPTDFSTFRKFLNFHESWIPASDGLYFLCQL
jgi:hypothetical protein